jgi:predicted outer membrane repeat protein
LRGVSISNCSTEDSGGGLAVYGSRVVLQDCQLAGNVAGGCGGAVYAEGSSLLLLDSNFTENVGNK